MALNVRCCMHILLVISIEDVSFTRNGVQSFLPLVVRFSSSPVHGI